MELIRDFDSDRECKGDVDSHVERARERRDLTAIGTRLAERAIFWDRRTPSRSQLAYF